MQKIIPCLWFNDNAEEAVNFYTSVFPNSRVTSINRYGKAGPGPESAVMSATFEIEGQELYALNGNSQFGFTPSISLFINCNTQDEVDRLWEKLSEGGEKSRCGWLTDKFGISWQVVPVRFSEFIYSKDKDKAARAMKAMMQMDKLDIAKMEEAYNSE